MVGCVSSPPMTQIWFSISTAILCRIAALRLGLFPGNAMSRCGYSPGGWRPRRPIYRRQRCADVPRSFRTMQSACNGKSLFYELTAVPQGPLGFLTTWPADQPQPLVSTLNANLGGVTANSAIVPAAANGDISVFVSNPSDVVINVNGYFAPPAAGGLSLFALTPCRVLDTRTSPVHPPTASPFDVSVALSGCGAPTTAQSFVLNATVVPPGPFGFLTLWPRVQHNRWFPR